MSQMHDYALFLFPLTLAVTVYRFAAAADSGEHPSPWALFLWLWLLEAVLLITSIGETWRTLSYVSELNDALGEDGGRSPTAGATATRKRRLMLYHWSGLVVFQVVIIAMAIQQILLAAHLTHHEEGEHPEEGHTSWHWILVPTYVLLGTLLLFGCSAIIWCPPNFRMRGYRIALGGGGIIDRSTGERVDHLPEEMVFVERDRSADRSIGPPSVSQQAADAAAAMKNSVAPVDSAEV